MKSKLFLILLFPLFLLGESFNLDEVGSFTPSLFGDLDEIFGRGKVVRSYSNGRISPPGFTWKKTVHFEERVYKVSVQIHSVREVEGLNYRLQEPEFYFRDIVSTEILKDGRKRTKAGNIHVRFGGEIWKDIFSETTDDREFNNVMRKVLQVEKGAGKGKGKGRDVKMTTSPNSD